MRGLLLAVTAVAGLMLTTSVIQVAVLRFVDPPATVDMAVEAILERLFDRKQPGPEYRWRPLNRISVHLQRAVIAAEDQRFLVHNGFDLVEIRNAVDDLIGDGRLRGASTITMQTARSLFLPQSRSVWRKMAEIHYTWMMEWMWPKHRILEVYLNTVDWGTGLIGAEAASRSYFDKSAAALSRNEAAWMAAVLPNPHRFSPTRPSAWIRSRHRRILRDMPAMAVPKATSHNDRQGGKS